MIWSVFKQGPAKIIPNRPEDYEANFIYMGQVEARSQDEAFKKAHDKYCAAPVLERKGMQ